MKPWFIALVATAGLCTDPAALAAEHVQLTNGFALRCDHRELIGETTRLYQTPGNSSFVDVPTAEIERFDPEPTPLSPVTPVSVRTFSAASIPNAVASASTRHALDSDFLTSVIRAESGFHPSAVSRKGARGLMQLMPGTAQQLGVLDSFDPAQNVDGGAHYLSDLLDRYHGDAVKALAAYNAGPNAVDKYHGVPPYRETQQYVASIIRDYNRKKLAQQRLARTSHHNARKTTHATAPNPTVAANSPTVASAN